MLSLTDIELMRNTQNASMMDVCRVLTPVVVEGEFGQEDIDYIPGPEIPCGFETESSSRGGSIAGLVVSLSARFRLQDGKDITPDHRIELVKRSGKIVSQIYQVQGWPKFGITCWIIEAKRI